MSTLSIKKCNPEFVQEKMNEIASHPAWYHDISGTEAEILLRHKADNTYLLRQGEREGHFYLSSVKGNVYFKHVPFTLNNELRVWLYRNGFPLTAPTLQLFIPAIMHLDELDCVPLIKLVDL